MINDFMDILSISLAVKELGVDQLVVKACASDNTDTFRTLDPDFCILAVKGQGGLNLAKKIRGINPTTPLILICDNLTKSIHEASCHLQPLSILAPGATVAEMKQTFGEALASKNTGG